MDTDNTVSALLLKVAESFDKFPSLKYAANNARILAEPEKYSAAEIQPCPDGDHGGARGGTRQFVGMARDG